MSPEHRVHSPTGPIGTFFRLREKFQDNYRTGSMISLVTWIRQNDKHWFAETGKETRLRKTFE
jgi:hypothetical protein